MKYNISNLNKFKNNSENGIFENIVNTIAKQSSQIIEDKVKELISPHIEIKLIENKNSYEIRDILKEKGFVLTVNRDIKDTEEYCICEHLTGNKDYFIVKSSVVEVKDKIYTSKNYISDIVRGIKKHE